jgi:prepilin-type N-terminal cleavage/methylation domain-containing protein
VTIRSPKHNSQGFTLVEMLVSLIIIGIIMGVALPSFLWLNKPLRSGALQFKAQLSLIRSKAISSNQSYRLRPNPDPDPNGTRDFIVETATNCRITALGGTNGWQRASQFDLDLPKDIRITDIATTISYPLPGGLISNSLGTGICFDSRGIVTTPTRLILKDFRGDNKAKIAMLDIGLLGNVDIYTYDSNTSASPTWISTTNEENPEF